MGLLFAIIDSHSARRDVRIRLVIVHDQRITARGRVEIRDSTGMCLDASRRLLYLPRVRYDDNGDIARTRGSALGAKTG